MHSHTYIHTHTCRQCVGVGNDSIGTELGEFLALLEPFHIPLTAPTHQNTHIYTDTQTTPMHKDRHIHKSYIHISKMFTRHIL